MIKTILAILLSAAACIVNPPEVKVSGAMKNVMMNGDSSAHLDIDTLNKTHLYGLGPVAGLKGEIMILDGKVFSTAKDEKKLLNQQDMVSKAALLVYSNVAKWKTVSIKVSVDSYAALEKLVETTAKENGYDTELAFAFKIELTPKKISYHVIDWKEGTVHTMENHKQFAYEGQSSDAKTTLLGFYSTHHQSIFTHHTTYMHVHLLDEKTKTVGHLDEIKVNGQITIYLPKK
ncbi:MAG: acetolactate decarboxylase [Chitinophagaceae bacterium]|nr:acetolactate decarboxylase [Chitinophagaceae bacterium]